MKAKNNLHSILSQAGKKKEIKRKRKPRLNSKEKETVTDIKNSVKEGKRAKKIKQTFTNDGTYQYSDKLVLRLVKNGVPISECHREYSTEIARNANKVGALCVYKENVLTRILEVKTDEKDLVYVVEEVDNKTRDDYIKRFGEIRIKSYFQTSIKYTSPKKG